MDARMLIGGQWRRESRHHLIEVLNKYDHRVVGTIPQASERDVGDAIAAAETAFEKPLAAYERFAILSKAAHQLLADKESLARLLVQEVGKTIREARGEVDVAAAALLNAAEEAKRIDGETVPVDANPGSEHRFAIVMHTPSGPVCAITPFNAPLNQAAHKVASAIAAGNTVVLKPSEQTPLTALRLAQILQDAGLPDGVFNLIFGYGQPVGEQLLRDRRFARYSFTGSVGVGRHILATVGVRPVTLELGSNAPTIIFPDADLTRAAHAVRASGYAIAGQVCTSVQRLYVHSDVLEHFTDIFVPLVQTMRLGDPMSEDTDIGPMLTDQAAERAEQWLQEAVRDGARILTGGTRHGRLFTPTVVTDVRPDMSLVCREVFAPIVSILPFTDTDAVIRSANDTDFGLQAGIFTRNLSTAFYVARRLRYGGVMVNDASFYRAPNQPYGGVKDSGFGREGPKYAIRELTDYKTVIFNLDRP